MSSTTIYLKLPQVKEVYEPEVYLGMIADVHSSDRAAEAKAKAVKITSFSGKGKEAVFVGNVMELVEKIEKTGQNIQVDNLGESDFVVTYRAGKKESLVWEWMKTAMVSAVAFFGAAFAIMTFNNDANVTDVFAKFYEMIIGDPGGRTDDPGGVLLRGTGPGDFIVLQPFRLLEDHGGPYAHRGGDAALRGELK